MSVRARLIGIFACVLAFVVLGYSLLVMYQWLQAIATYEAQTSERLQTRIGEVLEQRYEEATLGLALIAQSPVIQKAFAERDAKLLLADLLPGYREVAKSIPQFQFHLPNARSFLRVHSPEKRGDDLSGFRETVVVANRELREVHAIEMGVAGLGMRIVRPMFYEGRHIGSVEYGLDMGPKLVADLKGSSSDEYAVYLLHDDNSSTSLARTPGVLANLPAKLNFDRLRGGHSLSTPTRDGLKTNLLVPFGDISGKTIGFFQVLIDRTFVLHQVESIRNRLVGITILALVFGSLMMVFSTRAITDPIRSIVGQSQTISREIVAGNLEYRGDIQASPKEFRPIITEINTIINALRSSESQRLAILDGFPGMVLYIDAQERLLWASRRSLEFLCEPIKPPFPAIELSVFPRAMVRKAFRRNEIVRRTQRIDPRPGTPITKQMWWETVCVPVNEAGRGGPTHVVAISLDITEQTEASGKLEDLNRTLEDRVADEIRQRKAQEEQAYRQAQLASLGELAAGIAHEINQPLAALGLAVENLLARYRDGTIEVAYAVRKSNAVHQDLLRIRSIVDHVRELSRQETSGDDMQTFDVRSVVENASLLFQTQYRAHGLAIHVGVGDRALTIRGHRLKLEQAILNIVSNAYDAASESDRPRIELFVYADSDHAFVAVRDNGPGIGPEIADRIFDPFFTTKDPGKGTGLGLSISNSLVQRMEGRILFRPTRPDVDRRPERWWSTEMTIELPLFDKGDARS